MGRVDELIDQAIAKGDTGQFEESLILIDAALNYEPDNPYIWIYKAAALENLRNFTDAIDCSEKAISLDSKNHVAWLRKGSALFSMKHSDEALKFIDIAIHHKQDFAEAWSFKGYVLNMMKRFQEAITCCETALRYQPDMADAWAYKAYALENLGKYAEAIRFYDVALKYAPDLIGAKFGKADCIFLSGMKPAISGSFSDVITQLHNTLNQASKEIWQVKRNDDFDTHTCAYLIHKIVTSLFRAGFISEAKDFGNQVHRLIPAIIADDPDLRTDSLRDIVMTLAIFDGYEKALYILDNIPTKYGIFLNNEDQSILRMVAVLGLVEGRHSFDEAIDIAHQIKDVQIKETVLGHIGEELSHAGYFEKAISITKELDDSSPDEMQSYYLLGICVDLWEKEMLQKAVDVCSLIKNVRLRKPTLVRISAMFARQGSAEKAKDLLKEALEIHCDDDNSILTYVATTLAELGDFQEAFNIAKQINKESTQHSALREISGVLASKDRLSEAMNIAGSLYDEEIDSRCLCSIVEGLVKAGNLEKAHDLALIIKDEDNRADALEAVGKGYVKTGKSFDVYEIAKEIPEEYRFKSHLIIEEVTKHLASTGRLEEALFLADDYFDCAWRASLLCEIYTLIKEKSGTGNACPNEIQVKICPKCNLINYIESNFCDKCGTKFK